MRIPPAPPVGHVVAYEYLWSSKADRREDGEKVYPTALILAKSMEFGSPLVYALGISHKPPNPTERALEVPRKMARWLGLDDRPQWLYTNELNIFVWPGPDLRPATWISSRKLQHGSCVLGPLPQDWFEEVKRDFLESARLQRLKVTKQLDPPVDS